MARWSNFLTVLLKTWVTPRRTERERHWQNKSRRLPCQTKFSPFALA